MTPFKNLGYKPPVQSNPKNWVLESAQPSTSTLPAHTTDITPFRSNPNIYDQYQIPDCVENAVCFAQRYITWKATGIIPNLCRRELAIKTVAADGLPFSDGTSLESALEVARTQGIADAQYFPDDHTLPEAEFIGASIPQTAVDSAAAFKIPSYAQVTDVSVNGLKNAISQNGIVLIGIKVSDSWWTAANGTVSWAEVDILPIRPPTSANPVVSGHCIALYAYDEQYFYFCNWWSGDWGEMGRGWFGVNDLPEVYEAFVVGNFTKPTSPAPEPANVQNATVDVIPTVIEEVVEEVAKVVESIL